MSSQHIKNVQHHIKTIPSSKSQIGSNEDPFDLDDHDSTKTSDTLEEKIKITSFFRSSKIDSLQNDAKSLNNLCKTIKQKQSTISKLETKIQVLTNENGYLKQKLKLNEKSIDNLGKQNLQQTSIAAQLKYFESALKQKDQDLQEQSQKKQHEVNLLYSSLNARLKSKQVQCYLTSKNLKEQKVRTLQLLDEIKLLKLQDDKSKKIINFYYQQKQKLVLQKQQMRVELKQCNIALTRLTYCENQMSLFNDHHCKQRQRIKNLQIDLQNILKQKDRLEIKLSKITNKSGQTVDLAQRVFQVQKQLQRTRRKGQIDIQKLQTKAKVFQLIAQEANEEIFRSKLSLMNDNYKHRIL